MDLTKERILCASIWFPEKEVNVAHKPRNIEYGIVFSGLGHAHCISQASAAFYPDYQNNGDHDKMRIHFNRTRVDGFLTSKNRFVKRKEGAKIALECGQIKKLGYSSSKLYSEDLYNH